jgi:hypothetical protein
MIGLAVADGKHAAPQPETDFSQTNVAILRASIAAAFEGASVVLKRDGKKPVRFSGELLAEATSHAPGGTQWAEISIYARDKGGFALAIRNYSKAAHFKDHHRADIVSSLSEAIELIEKHDPAYDIAAANPVDDSTTPLAELVVQAVALKQRVAEARAEYRSISGEIIAALEPLAAE